VAVTLLATEFVRHDIALQKLVEGFGADAVAEFWSTDPDLQRIKTGVAPDPPGSG